MTPLLPGLLTLAQVAVAAPGNMCPNPGFEAKSGWQTARWGGTKAAFVRDAGVARGGQHSGRVSSAQPRAKAGFSHGYFGRKFRLPAQGGVRYRLSTYAKGASGEGIALVMIFFGPTGDRPLSEGTRTSTTTRQWQRYALTKKAPPDAASVRIDLRLWRSAGTVWFDDVFLGPAVADEPTARDDRLTIATPAGASMSRGDGVAVVGPGTYRVKLHAARPVAGPPRLKCMLESGRAAPLHLLSGAGSEWMWELALRPQDGPATAVFTLFAGLAEPRPIPPMNGGSMLVTAPDYVKRRAHPFLFFKPEDLARAKRNLHRYDWARGVVAHMKKVYSEYLDLPDETIRRMFVCPTVPPHHPQALHLEAPTDPVDGSSLTWKWQEPLVLRNATTGRIYPNADFPDEGNGCVVDDQTYRFVEYATSRIRHQFWWSYFHDPSNYFLSFGALLYALTDGPERIEYARKTALFLDAIARHYPSYAYWGLRPGERPDDVGIHRKFQPSTIHADQHFTYDVANAYDLIYDSGALTDAMKARIENDLLLDIVKDIRDGFGGPGRKLDNWHANRVGMVATVGVLLERPDLVHFALTDPCGGLWPFIDNGVDGYGLHWENMHYGLVTLEKVGHFQEALRGYRDFRYDESHPYYDPAQDGLNLFRWPKFRSIFSLAYRELYDPAGTIFPIDAAYPTNRLLERESKFPKLGYCRGRDAACGILMRQIADHDPTHYRHNVKDLFYCDEWPAPGQLPALTSQNIDGNVGLSILRSRDDRAALALSYGAFMEGTGHPDLLNLVYFAHGGYVLPEWYHQGWDLNSFSAASDRHNVVLINGRGQQAGCGHCRLFATSPRVSIARASAEQAYPEADTHQRTAILVEPEPGLSYAVDVFVITGEDIETSELLIQAPRSVADTEGLVEARSATGPGWQSGQHYRVSGPSAAITAVAGEGGSVRFHLLSELDEVVIGKRPHPDPIPDTYPTDRETISLQRRDDGRFVSVVEPFVDEPIIGRASRIDVGKGAVGIQVERSRGCERLFLANGEQATVDLPDAQVSFRGQFAAIGTDQEGRLSFMQLVNGDQLQSGGYAIRDCSAITGQVTDWDAEQRTLTVQTEATLQPGEWYAGETVLVGRGECTSSFTIKRVERLGDQRYRLCLADAAELEIYRSRVHRVSANGWVTGYSSMPRVYKAIGAWLLNPRHPDPKATACRIAQVDPWNTFIVEDKPELTQSFRKDDPLVVALVSVGDAFTIPSRFYLEQVGPDRYEVETNCPSATLTLPRPKAPAGRLAIEQTEGGGRDEQPLTKDHVTVDFRQRANRRGRYALRFAK